MGWAPFIQLCRFTTNLMYLVISTIVGARLGHVFFYAWDYYSQHPIEILYTWEGGLARRSSSCAGLQRT